MGEQSERAAGVGIGMDVLAEDLDPPLGGAREPRDAAEEGGLAGAVRAQQQHHFAGGHEELNPTQRDHRPEATLEMVDLQQRSVGGGHPQRGANGIPEV